jgi:hypothetical protein
MEREGWELLRISAQRLLAVLKGVEPEEGVLVDPRELAVMLEATTLQIQDRGFDGVAAGGEDR